MKQYLHFKSSVGRRLLSVDEIIEVIPMVSLQREASDSRNEKFCGLLNFRGKIVPVFNLSKYDEDLCRDPSTFLVVTNVSSSQMAIMALELDYLLDIPDENINVIQASDDFSFKVAKVGEEMVRIVQSQEFIC